MMKISALVIIFTFTIASCVPAFFFPDQFERLYETWLDTCTENEEMPYFNKSLDTFQAPVTPDRCQVKRPPPSLQNTSNFLVFYGLSHGTTLKKKGVAVF
jgi:hypothetical protein